MNTTSNWNDFNDADAQQGFDLVPRAGTARDLGQAVGRRHAGGVLRQRLPDRVVERLNAQRGREAVTAIARTARPVEAAAAEAAQPVQAIAAAAVAEPRVAVEVATPVIRFAPAPAARPIFAATAGIGEQVRQADARQAFQAAVVAQVAETAQPMGMPTASRNVIDQRV